MAHVKDGITLIDAKPVPRPGRWISAVIVAIFALLLATGFITNDNYQWDVVGKWLFSKTIVSGVVYTLILTVIAMTIGTILAITFAIMRQSINPVLRWVATAYI